MADNFNLRQFLTENKLTKNAKLLSESTDISQAFSQAGITGEVTVAFYSEHGMSEPEFEVMSAQDALAMIASKAKGAEDVLIAQGDEIDQQGDLDPQTKGLECKLEVAILNHGTYEVYQGSNSLNEGSDYGYEAVVDAIADHFDEGSYEYDQVLKAVEDKFHSNQIDTSDFSHDPSAPSRIVADIADELGLGEYENDEPSAGKYVSRRDIEENAEGDGWKYFDIDGDEVEGLYMDTVDGVKIYSMTDSSVADTVSYVLEDPDGYVETIHIDVSGQPVSSEDIENEHEVVSYIADFIADDINSELGLNEAFDHDAPQGDSYEEVVAWLDDKYPDASQYSQFVAGFKKELRNLPQDKKSQWTAKFKKDYGSLDEAKSYKVSKNSKEAQHLKKGDIIGSGDEVVSVSAGAKTPSGKVEVTLKTKDGKTKTSTWGKTTKIGVKEKETVNEAINYDNLSKHSIKDLKSTLDTKKAELKKLSAKEDAPAMIKGKIKELQSQIGKLEREIKAKEKETVKENTMTKRDKYLTRLVENALGMQPSDDDEVEFNPADIADEEDYRRDQYRGNMEEGDEMADETVIPEYRTIDELMKSIDHGTNKVAEEHKMQEMKKIAEALRIKAKRMEESEHAAHISPKDLKQLATDAAKLEKAAEKLKAAFDKKFNKKEKAPAAKAEKVEALQEGTFDLRNFLVENKLTSNSKMLNEAQSARAYALIIDEDGNFIKEDLSNYSEESYLDPEGEKLSGMEEVLNYPETVSAWQHAPELKDSQDAEWKQAVAELGNSYMYYDVIGDGGENAVIAAIPQGSSLTDYIQDDF